MSRIRDPQRLVELVADTMFRERELAERTRRRRSQPRDDDAPVRTNDPKGDT